VLELAAGTGIFTALLLAHAEHVTAVDASPEALAINAARNGTDRVEHAVADLFEWEPPACSTTSASASDLARAGHALGRLRAMVARWCPGPGLVLRTTPGPITPSPTARRCSPGWATRRPDGVEDSARARDGRQFTIVKRYRSPPELDADLAGLGWSGPVRDHDLGVPPDGRTCALTASVS
jgi:demethylmenaquinone methyltransferase/2-methoxy-6-polyprenyl-1,4-benzoquinol methylase